MSFYVFVTFVTTIIYHLVLQEIVVGRKGLVPTPSTQATNRKQALDSPRLYEVF